MRPVDFKESNGWLRGRDDFFGRPVADLRVHRTEFLTISKWRMTWRERFAAFFFGVVWVSVCGHVCPPIALDGCRTMFLKESRKRKK